LVYIEIKILKNNVLKKISTKVGSKYYRASKLARKLIKRQLATKLLIWQLGSKDVTLGRIFKDKNEERIFRDKLMDAAIYYDIRNWSWTGFEKKQWKK